MRIVLFLCYCLGWLVVLSSAIVTALLAAVVYFRAVIPAWLFGLLRFKIEAAWQRLDTATFEGTILLFVLVTIMIALGSAQVWFARRFGFWLPFQSPVAKPYAHEEHPGWL